MIKYDHAGVALGFEAGDYTAMWPKAGRTKASVRTSFVTCFDLPNEQSYWLSLRTLSRYAKRTDYGFVECDRKEDGAFNIWRVEYHEHLWQKTIERMRAKEDGWERKRFLGDSFDRVAQRYVVDESTGCWNWTGCKDKHGYGHMKWENGYTSAHKMMYRAHKGEVPDGLHLDHLCRNTSCINPEHLEAVTPRENFLRGSHPAATTWRTGFCRRGHGPEEMRYTSGGRGRCMACNRIWEEERRRKKNGS